MIALLLGRFLIAVLLILGVFCATKFLLNATKKGTNQ
jgi:hypothetical protein